MRRSAPLAACGLLLSNFALAGPFGLEMGTALTDLQKQFTVTQKSPNLYELSAVPQPHIDFNSYRVLATTEHGVCKIQAISKNITTSAYGEAVERDFNRIAEALDSKYGNSKRYDVLKHGSIWKEPKYWMMGLLKKERMLTAFWTGDSMPDNVSTIMLETYALDREHAVMTLGYEFSNFKSCMAAIKATDNASL